jgi:hypothetical protein
MKVKDLEYHREHWAKVAKKNNWYTEPFYVQVWVYDDGTVEDSVSFVGIDKDYIVEYVEENEEEYA